MTAIDKIKEFLYDTSDISIGYNEITFFPSNKLEENQVGYSFDPNAVSLTAEQVGEWQDGWIAIANDNLGDPFIVDANSNNLTVLSAAHGEGTWRPFIVADSLDKFKNIISIIKKVSESRTNPVDLEKNPINDNERHIALREIKDQNPLTELWFWETYFEN